MKSFMMRGVILAALLSLLCLPASATWSTTDSNNLSSSKTYLNNIYNILNQSSLSSRLGTIVTNTTNSANYLSTISTRIGTSNTWPTINGQLTKIIDQNTDMYSRVGYIKTYTNDIKTDIASLKTTVSNIYSKMPSSSGTASDLTTVNSNTTQIKSDVGQLVIKQNATMTYAQYINDKIDTLNGYISSVKSDVQQLKEVLASDEDKAMRDAQKENSAEVKDSFLSGSSSGSSLGKSDFSDLSSIGGTYKDVTSLNGQASLSSFTAGLTQSHSQGSRWFSAGNRDSLDTVPKASTSSAAARARSRASDPDPYNMNGFDSQYSWLFGGDGK